MARPGLEVADVFRQYGQDYRERHAPALSPEQSKVMRAVSICRTAALGGHVEQCDACGHQVISYNSCRNRHCPKCQSLDKARWLEARRAEVLPVEYHHVIFTLPEHLAPLALQNQRVVYGILFQAASQALVTLAADPKHLGARIGLMAVLHTWGQTLTHHPHLHCVVPGGGLNRDGDQWIACRDGFLFPVTVLSRLFRRLFMEALENAFKQGALQFHGKIAGMADARVFFRLANRCRKMEWVVFSRPPFGGAGKVLDYLGRYVHRVAISNHRLKAIKDGRVTFSWKDYRDRRDKVMTLDAGEFIRRFLQHVLPPAFVRIRYYGLLANGQRAKNLTRCRKALGVQAADPGTAQEKDTPPLGWADLLEKLTGRDPRRCPQCQNGTLRLHQTLRPPRDLRQPRSRDPPHPPAGEKP